MADEKDPKDQEQVQEPQEPFEGEGEGEEENALAKAQDGKPPAPEGAIESAYAALAMGPEERRDLAEGIGAAAGAEGINAWDLPRVTLPAGGGTIWEIPGAGEPEHSPSIRGIIIHATSPRAYWEKSLEESGGSMPPDCSSVDGIRGTIYGDCYECEFNQWGSAETGEGKACKEKRMLFVLREGSYLPLVVQAPSTSIPAVKNHFVRSASEYGLPYKFVESELKLEKYGSGAFPYSRIVPSITKALSREEKAVLSEYIEHISPAFRTPQATVIKQDE